MSAKINIPSGTRFTRLTIIGSYESSKHGQLLWLCQCDCGNLVKALSNNLRLGKVKSCGCLRAELLAASNRKHGKSKTPEYTAWTNMLARCNDPMAIGYDSYGGRGISVCYRWLVLDNFLSDMGPRPSGQHSIDRIDNNGNYEPLNCKWSTRGEQRRNTSRNTLITFDGETMVITDWATRIGMSVSGLAHRLKWLSVEDALTIPKHQGVKLYCI